MLATASRRGGDVAKASHALFNLGVTLDNTQQYSKAIEVRSRLPFSHPFSSCASAPLRVPSLASAPSHPHSYAFWLCSFGCSCLQSYKKFLKAAKEANNVQAQCLGYNSIAISYQNKGDLESALRYHARHAKVAGDARVRSVLPPRAFCSFVAWEG